MGTWQVEKYFDFVKYSGKTKFWIKRLSIVPEVIGEETRLEQLIPTVQEDQTLECDSRFAYMYR
jgi:hypothetical protein